MTFGGVLAFFTLCAVCFAQNMGDEFMPTLPVGVPHSSDPTCKYHSDLYLENLKNLSLWAYEMLDATARSSVGVLRGSVFHMGNFDQCLSARAPFETKYCLATVIADVPRPENPRKDPISLYFKPDENVLQRLYKYKDKTQQSRNVINLGWCVPSSCSPDDLEGSLNIYLENETTLLSDQNVTYSAKINNLFCQSESDLIYFDGLDISFCVLCVVIILLVVGGSSYDFSRIKTPETKLKRTTFTQKMILAFSVKKNFLDLTKIDERNNALKILYGIKTFSILLIIMDHRFGTFVSSAIFNFDYVERQYRSPFACFIFHGDLFVDTFFMFSGLLVAYGLLGQFEKRKVNAGFLIILRYIRLTPVYAFVIFYYATLFNHTGSGPLWKLIAGGDSQDCRTNWWTNLLYISNYVNADHMCMTHSWYLPCDFHYFIIAIGICLLIHQKRKLGLYTLFMVVIISLIIPFLITVLYQRPAMLFFYPDFLTSPKNHPDFLMTYSKSHTRATPYFVGMFSGYIYHKLKGSNYHIPMKRSLVILATSIILLLGAILTGAVFYNPYHPYSAVESGLYSALHRVAWALGSVGLLYVASFGHAIPLNRILTWSPWIPLSKLIYSAYLIHMQFQLRAAAQFRNPQRIGYFDTISLALSDMILSFLSAFVLYLCIEAPLRNIFKELLMPNKSPQTTRTPKEIIEEEPVMENNIVRNMVHYEKETTSRL
ncbi:nose resistant to fluoxetine protein 6-like [Coccinella septempunctata]|uniref:nose resistant to fluoxetine protein 6-like n=1 Tax=Coccinella septempunctata TaxID=41139 RepID=UPI001D073F98|nr:nose resistant to fluoxetine protein 6-like [Coccinella septempunctata]